ncbi:MAG: hypothetical protein Q8T13_16370 [Acidobacteriota bacterium]|nr:hypothetical protein [Acidobacteriota bacterium]
MITTAIAESGVTVTPLSFEQRCWSCRKLLFKATTKEPFSIGAIAVFKCGRCREYSHFVG